MADTLPQHHDTPMEALAKYDKLFRMMAWMIGCLIGGAFALGVWVTTIQSNQAELQKDQTAIRSDLTEIKTDRAIKIEQFQQMRTDVQILREKQEVNASTLNRIADKLGVVH